MSNEESLFEPINCEIVDSFVRYTKLKATKGKGEAWLYVGRDADSMKFDIFFSNFRRDNKYYFKKKNLISYIEDAEHEYKNQINFHKKKDILGYRHDIYKKYNFFKQTILSLKGDLYFKDIKKRIDGGRYYIRPKVLNNDHAWNFIRDFALPQISEFKITKERMPENYSFYFELKFNVKNKDFFDHNSQFLINQNIEDIKKRHVVGSLEYERLIKARNGQGYFKEQILKRMDCCMITGSKEILEAAHIKPWAKANDEEKIDGFNGILLTPNCHKLFDKGLICFQNDGSIKKSNKISPKNFDRLIIEDKKLNRKPISNEKTQAYLVWHRKYWKKNFV